MHLKCANNCWEWGQSSACCWCSVLKCVLAQATPQLTFYLKASPSPLGNWYKKILLRYSWRGGFGAFNISLIILFLHFSDFLKEHHQLVLNSRNFNPLSVSIPRLRESNDYSPWSQQLWGQRCHTAMANDVKFLPSGFALKPLNMIRGTQPVNCKTNSSSPQQGQDSRFPGSFWK